MTLPESVTQRAGRGARWAVLQNAGKHGIELLVFLCLARQLASADFGLVALASAVVVLATVLAELGLGEALMQRRDLDDTHCDTAFWCAVAVGLTLALSLWCAAPWVAAKFDRPGLEAVLQAMSPLFVLQALGVVPQALLQRDLNFRPLTLRALAGSIAAGITGLVMAMQGAGAWSLVALQLVSASTALVGLWWFSKWRPGSKVSLRSARELLGFGRFVAGTRVLNVVASKADDLVVGLFLGPVALGFYSVSCRMQLALEQLFCQGVDAVALSAFSQVGAASQRLRELFAAATQTAAWCAYPVFGGAALFAPEIIELAVGAHWLPSAALLRWLVLAGLLQALTHFNQAAFKATGRPELPFRIAMASTALNALTLALAIPYGVQAVAVSCLVRSALLAPVGVVLACRVVGLPLHRYLTGLLRPAAGLGVACVGAQWLLQAYAAGSALHRLVVAGSAFVLLSLLCTWALRSWWPTERVLDLPLPAPVPVPQPEVSSRVIHA
jgi:O-antigen/teichoic acid export membrane protein